MARKGPMPTPTEVLRQRGSWRADQREPEPEPMSDKPDMPRGLTARAKKRWQFVVDQLEAMGILSVTDEAAIERYARMWDRWLYLDGWITRHGYDIDGKQPPQITQYLQLADKLLRVEQHFGLTPSARAGLAGIKIDKSQTAATEEDPVQRALKLRA